MSEIDPKWKWGSMIVSLVLLAFSWLYPFYWAITHRYGSSLDTWITLFFVGCPLVIYLMYKERKVKIKYGRAWIIVPILLMLIGMSSNYYINNWGGMMDNYGISNRSIIFQHFLELAVPAIIIDLYTMHKIYGK